jgi:hypothetical protein
MRAAFEHLARYTDLRRVRIVAGLLAPAARILRNAARFRHGGFVLGRPPIRRPFLDIADHFVEAVAIRRKGLYRRGACVTVEGEILVREFERVPL